MDVSKDLWGPALWRFYQITASVQTDRVAFNDSLRVMCSLLPCPECRLHLKDHVDKNPPEEIIFDTEDASAYIFSLHNAVNERLGKTIFPVSSYEVLYGPLNRTIIPVRFLGSTTQAAQPRQSALDPKSLLMGTFPRGRIGHFRSSSLRVPPPSSILSRPAAPLDVSLLVAKKRGGGYARETLKGTLPIASALDSGGAGLISSPGTSSQPSQRTLASEGKAVSESVAETLDPRSQSGGYTGPRPMLRAENIKGSRKLSLRDDIHAARRRRGGFAVGRIDDGPPAVESRDGKVESSCQLRRAAAGGGYYNTPALGAAWMPYQRLNGGILRRMQLTW